MHSSRLIVLAAIVLNLASNVFGSLDVTLVDAANIGTMPFIIRTSDADSDKSLFFSVIAAPRDRLGFSLGSADFAIYNGTNFTSSNFIASSSIAAKTIPSNMQDVKESLVKNGVLYEFEVSTNNLTSADFEIGYVSDSMPAQMNYRFALQTFFHRKGDVGLLLGIRNFKVNH